MATASFKLSSLTAPPRSQKISGFSKILGGVKILGGDSKSSEKFLKIRKGFKYFKVVSNIEKGFKKLCILLMAGLQFRYAHVYTSFTFNKLDTVWDFY